MGFIEIFLIGIGLSMDAFAVAVGKGLAMSKVSKKQTLVIALFFGGFQALMPFIGWALGSTFAGYIKAFDHWIAFILLLLIGGKMIIDAIREMKKGGNEDNEMDSPLNIKELLLMAIATSIDALAIGVTFSFLSVNIGFACLIIGFTTFALSWIGVYIGNFFGVRYRTAAQIIGGIILLFIGSKILIEHLFFGG